MIVMESLTTALRQKKRVYINQFNSASARNLIPLAAGLLHAHAVSIPTIREHYTLELEILRDEPQRIVDYYQDPFILAYSCYFWNLNQSLIVAEGAKKRFPQAFIIMGGPSVPLSQAEIENFYHQYPFVNILVGGEGEQVFSDILLALAEGKGVSDVDGISYRKDNGEIVIKPRRGYIKDVSILPSPYLDGTFDQLLDRYGNILTGVVLETNRGCPFTCTFCFWGGPDTKISQFSQDRVFQELEWISKNKIAYVYGADANFGILKRDLDIAKHLAHLHRTTGYPSILMINWTKNATDKIFDIVDVLNEGGVTFMLTTSVQSHNLATLKAIKRENIRLEAFQKILEEASKRNFHTYSELILGLPLETYQTFKAGVVQTLTPNPNYHFHIFNCIIIPGTEMAHPDYLERYQIQTRQCELHLAKTTDKDAAVKEYQNIVVSTSTLSIEDWRKCYAFGYFAKALYGFRTAFFLFLYLQKEHNVEYGDLLEEMIQEINRHSADYPSMAEALAVLRRLTDSILQNGRETIKLDWVEMNLQPEVAVLVTLLRHKEQFYSEVYHCLLHYFRTRSIPIDVQRFQELLVYQFCKVSSWSTQNTHVLQFNYNFEDYFDYHHYLSLEPLRRCAPFTALIEDDTVYKDVDDYIPKQIYGTLVFKLAQFKILDKAITGREAAEYLQQLSLQKYSPAPFLSAEVNESHALKINI